MVQDYEKLGMFYLGRSYDLQTKQVTSSTVLYDAKDLVTHAVCVGMTGSGKTGLCIALLEEAAIDGIPAIVIDPKGDLGNLLLTFPNLSPEEFAPWINEDDARKRGVTPEVYAAQEAERWKKGLADWAEDADRIKRLREAADFAIYTPGSQAGLPVSILKSFAAPAPALLEDDELFRDRITTTATSLLGLLGIAADPIRSREHILISTLLDRAWRQREDLDLGALIQQIQAPPVTRIGVMDLEAFFPAKERFDLAMTLNNLLAAPGFSTWMEGEPLDIDWMLHTASGKPRVSIFSIAHLGDAERMFFVSLLLNQILGWVRTQSGTTSLRAIVYMDEIFGYFPPVANPPSKQPLLTLLKQARAFGVGVVLATQNPVDLDYKGLSNTGTWFIGRLQTDRDKDRVLDGLAGAAVGAAGGFDRTKMDEIVSGLGSRVFLMNNVHEDHPEVFQSRWDLSYLRGPLTQPQIRKVMASRKAAAQPAPTAAPEQRLAAPAAAPAAVAAPAVAAATGAAGTSAAAEGQRPVLPPGISQYFAPARPRLSAAASPVYQPMLAGVAQIHFADPKTGIDFTRDVTVVAPFTDGPIPVDWNSASDAGFDSSELGETGAAGGRYLPLPAAAARPKSYDAWSKDFVTWIQQSQKLDLLWSANLEVASNPGEDERAFRIRLAQSSRERRDEEVQRLRANYAPKIQALQDRIARAQQAVERESQQATAQTVQTAISFGATLLGAVLGRKTISTTSIGRATTAARGVGRTMRERQDIDRAKETVGSLQQQMADLEQQLRDETSALETKLDPGLESLQTIALPVKKTNVSVRLFGLAWVPKAN